MKLDDCLQERCAHCPLNNSIPDKIRTEALMMCPVCRKCGAPKHKINPDCKECIACENGEGYLRGDGRGQAVDVKVSQEIVLENQLDGGAK